MSLYVVTSRWLALKPRVSVLDDRIVIRPSILASLLWLFSYSRVVVIDRPRREILVRTRILWLFVARRAIPFSRVSSIDTGYHATETSWNIFREAEDTIETYSIVLTLDDPFEKQTIYEATGEGARETGLLGVFLGDSIADAQGDQENHFQWTLDRIREYVGAGSLQERTMNALSGGFRCAACRRPATPNRSACAYCGGTLVRDA